MSVQSDSGGATHSVGGLSVPWYIDEHFLKLWFGQTLTQLASQVVSFVFPLVAILVFQLGPAGVGLLNGTQYLPFVLVSLFAGVWVDAHERRPTLVGMHFGRALLLSIIPIAAITHHLYIGTLYLVAFGVGAMTVMFDVCHLSYIPDLVGASRVVDANSRLQSTYSLALLAGPALGGLLVAAFGASQSLVFAVAGYLAAGVAILSIRHRETPVTHRKSSSIFPRIKTGLRFIFQEPTLRMLTVQSAWFNLFERAFLTLYPVYAVREILLSPALLGLTLMMGGIGAVLGSFAAKTASNYLGLTRALTMGMGLASGAPLIIPLANSPNLLSATIVGFAFFLYGFGLAVFNVFGISLRQAIAPPDLIGRVTATYRFVAFGTIPLGAVLGGMAGEWMGLRGALIAISLAALSRWTIFARSVYRCRLGHVISGSSSSPPVDRFHQSRSL